MKTDIPDPCPEKWNSMTPTEEGAFCKVCNKDLFDLTKKSREEIDSFFSEKENKDYDSSDAKAMADMCGKFSIKQIFELNFDNFFERFRFWNFYRKIAVVFFFGFGLTLFSCSGSTDDRVGKFGPYNDTLMFHDSMIKQPAPEAPKEK